jgi:hypothetical protein
MSLTRTEPSPSTARETLEKSCHLSRQLRHLYSL